MCSNLRGLLWLDAQSTEPGGSAGTIQTSTTMYRSRQDAFSRSHCRRTVVGNNGLSQPSVSDKQCLDPVSLFGWRAKRRSAWMRTFVLEEVGIDQGGDPSAQRLVLFQDLCIEDLEPGF